MNVMVFNVAAESSGALSILLDFYEDIKNIKNQDVNWFFVLGLPGLDETDKIKVLRFPWIKKSWFHRLFFDNVIAPRLVKRYKIDKILSFQNVTIPHVKVEQTIYMHNSLPFVEHKFKIFENTKLWIYQNIIGRIIVKSIKKAKNTIVQSYWIKQRCLEKAKIPEDRITVIPPKLEIKVNEFYDYNSLPYNKFFYPATAFSYKNHSVIIDACKILLNKDVSNYSVLFTLTGQENSYSSNLFEEVNKNQLPIEFAGHLERDQVMKNYSKMILLFPSYIETFGLPLLEAKMHKDIIVASDCEFSNEILADYNNVIFFNHYNALELAEIMNMLISNQYKYQPNDNSETIPLKRTEIVDVLMK